MNCKDFLFKFCIHKKFFSIYIIEYGISKYFTSKYSKSFINNKLVDKDCLNMIKEDKFKAKDEDLNEDSYQLKINNFTTIIFMFFIISLLSFLIFIIESLNNSI